MSINAPNLQVASANSNKTRIPSLASIYQAKKSGDHSVEVLKQKFQTGIEHKMQHGQQQQQLQANHQIVSKPFLQNESNHEEKSGLHQNVRRIGNLNLGHNNLVRNNSESIYAKGRSNNMQTKRHSIATSTQRPQLPPPLPPTMIKQRGDKPIEISPQPFSATTNSISKGSETLRKLEREKSFEDARNAVQSQIEKIFQKQHNAKQSDQTNDDNLQSPYLSPTSQPLRRHDAVIGMGTPTLPGIFPSMSSQNKRSIDHVDYNDRENDNYRSTMNIRNDPLPPPPPPLPPNMPLHSLGILQKRMIVESTMKTENTRQNISSLSTKHRSMDSLVTAKIASPETLDYMSPPITPTRRNSPHNKIHRNLRNNENLSSSNIYGVNERFNSPINPPQGLVNVGIDGHYAQDENSSKNDIENNFSRRDTQLYQPQNKKRDGRDMRRSISHNSLAMRNRNQNQLHQHLSQQNSFDFPFNINSSNLGDIQSNHRKYHPQSQHYPNPRYQEKHHGDGSKHGSHIMTSSYPSDGGTTVTLGPMSMFGDFSIDPKKKDPRTQMSHPEISRGMQ